MGALARAKAAGSCALLFAATLPVLIAASATPAAAAGAAAHFTPVPGGTEAQQCPSGVYTVPADTELLRITAVGGSGGPGDLAGNFGGQGGWGASVSAIVPVTPNATLNVVVATAGAARAGGWGGGGVSATDDASAKGGGGGGASYVTTASVVDAVAAGVGDRSATSRHGTGCKPPDQWQDPDHNAIGQMLVVAGGGGGGGHQGGFADNGGDGGDAGLLGQRAEDGGAGGEGSFGGGGASASAGGGAGALHASDAECTQERLSGQFLTGGLAGVRGPFLGGTGSLREEGSGAGGSGLFGGGAGAATCGVGASAGGGGGSSYVTPDALFSSSAITDGSPLVHIEPYHGETTTTLSTSAARVDIGQSVTFTARVDPPIPLGAVQISATRGTSFLSLGDALVIDGVATLSVTLPDGAWSVVAHHVGDVGIYQPSTSPPITQLVGVPPVVTHHPSSQEVTKGEVATFEAAGTGDPAPTLQWQVAYEDDLSDWTDIPGATSSPLVIATGIPEPGQIQGGFGRYRAVFTNSVGSTPSSATFLRVFQAPEVTFNPVDAQASLGASVEFVSVGIGFPNTAPPPGQSPAPSAQWQVSDDGGSTWSDLPATSDNKSFVGGTWRTISRLRVSPVTSADSGNRYRTTFTNPLGSATTTTATLTVLNGCIENAPTPTTFSHCHGADLSGLDLDAEDLRWGDFSSANLTGTAVRVISDANLNGANLHGLVAPFAQMVNTRLVGADLTDAHLANGTLHFADFTRAVLTGATFANADLQGAIFTGTALVPANVTAYSTGASVPVSWPTPPSLPGATFLGCDHAPGDPFPPGATTVTCTIGDDQFVAGAFGHIRATGTFVVNVAPATTPVFLFQPGDVDLTYSPNATAGPTFFAGPVGSPDPTVQWQISTDGGAHFTDIPAATSFSLATPKPQVSDGGTQYRAVATNMAGSTTSRVATLTVRPVQILARVSGSQTFGGQPTFVTTDDAPGGVTLSGTVTCDLVIDALGFPTLLGPTVPVGIYTLEQCSGLSASDPNYAVGAQGLLDGFEVLALPIVQHAPTTGSTTAADSAAFTDQLVMDTASPTLFTQSTGATAITVSSLGGVSTTGPLAAGTYTATGSASDSAGGVGTWTYTLKVKADQDALVVTFPTTGTYGDELTPTASGGSGTGALTFTATGTACEMDADKLAITSGTGSCALTAHRAGDDDYDAASSPPQPVTVSKAVATLTFGAGALAQTYNGSPRPVTVNITPPGLSGVQVTYAGSATPPTNAGSYAVVASLAHLDYAAAPLEGTLAVAKAAGSVTITNIPSGATFGGTLAPAYTKAGDGTASTTSNTPSICSVSGGTVSFLALGTCKLQASVTEGTNHLAATGAEQSFVIGKAPTTTTVTVSSTAPQYSDKVTFTATISPDALNATAPATGVTFKVGTLVLNATPVALVPGSGAAAGKLVATLPDVVMQQAPGGYTVTAVFSGVHPSFIVYNATTPLTIAKENASAEFSGGLYYTVPSGSATVTLSAVVTDADDGSRGDIRSAKVTFLVNGSPATGCSNLSVGLVSLGDGTVGSATCNTALAISAVPYTIGIRVNGYYDRTAGADAVLTVAQATSNTISGGGYLVLQKSAGLKAGAPGSKANFGFNVKYNKSGTNPQGNMNIIVRSGGRVYQIKSNSITSFSANTTTRTATFNSKANIQDVTDPLNPISVDSNGSLQVTMTDKNDSGSTDTIAITLWNKSGGLWFSSNWSGTKTVEQVVGGGNVVVR
jgi:uncharacterized protein YjbI with pentapeptide repeats